MSFPKVSVIIPAYYGVDHLGEAIHSVLSQTYPHFEVLVVDDKSPDDIDVVISQFDDPRLIYLKHETNKGVDQARKTALEASSGEIIAFLDQDDYFHPEKLAAHVDYLDKHPEIGFSYNAYFNLNHSAHTIRDISQPLADISLADVVLGFPLPPSVMVMRRSWAIREELWDESTFLRGREIVFCGRLLLAGCQFGKVDRILNYRRYHAGRVFSNLEQKCADERACQEIIFDDARCPDYVLTKRNTASANIYMLWAYVAFAQEETDLGQTFIRQAVSLNPSLLYGNPSGLTIFFLMYAIDEVDIRHEVLLRRIFDQLPSQAVVVADQCEWAVGHGSILKGFRAIMWGEAENGRYHFESAKNQNARLDTFTTEVLTTQLIYFEAEFGIEATNQILQKLLPYLKQISSPQAIRSLKGTYSVNRAFRSYEEGHYKTVPKNVFQAVLTNPNYLANRGVLSILLRSSMNMWAKTELT